jgi:hypothetical protein
LQLRLIDVKCDGELVRIVAYDVGLFAIGFQKGIARRVIKFLPFLTSKTRPCRTHAQPLDP